MTNQTCESCSAPSDLYLCRRCIGDLREMLSSLVSAGTETYQVLKSVPVIDPVTKEPKADPVSGKPVCELKMVDCTRKMAGLIEHLRGYAVGQSKRGEQVRRTHHEPDTLNGDDSLAAHIDALVGCECPPDGDCVCDVSRARGKRANTALNRALAAGGVNAAASALHAEMHYSLKVWAKGIAKKHGQVLDWKTTTGFAHYLSQNVPKIALDEDAGHFMHRVRALIRITEKIIDLPSPPRECGPCPSDKETESGRSKCATLLTADHNATEVTCPECGETFKVDDLIQRLRDDMDEWHFTRGEIVLVAQFLNEPVKEHDIKNWCGRGKKIDGVLTKLFPRGYRRPGERAGEWHAYRDGPGDKPVYRMVDLRKFMADNKRKVTA